MTIGKIAIMINSFVTRKNYISIEDIEKYPLVCIDYLVAIRDELADNCTIANDKKITEAINTLIHLSARQLKAAIKAHRKVCIDEFFRRLSK